MLNEPYPSEAMSRMLDEVNTLEKQVYLEKYAVYTQFEQLMQITICVEYFKRSIPPLLLALRKEPERVQLLTNEENTRIDEQAKAEDERADALAQQDPEQAEALARQKAERAETVARQKAERAEALKQEVYESARALASAEAEKLKEIAKLAQVSYQDMLLFEKQIRQRFLDQRYCFIALTKDCKQRNYYDLQEDPASLRYITVVVCGNQECKARTADGIWLQPCGNCGKAAYCNRKCQKADWAFHKRFCKSLASKKEFIVKPVTGPPEKKPDTVEELGDDDEQQQGTQ